MENLEKSLIASETKFRKLFETAQDGIILMDPATEKITDINPYLLRLLQYASPAELIGKELWEIGIFKDITESKEAFKKLQEEKYIRYEDLPLKRKDGTRLDVEFVSNVYLVNGTPTIQCNVRDITDRKIAEEKSKVYQEGLEKMNKFMTGREIKMSDLKEEIEGLKNKLASFQ
jgi:PAS domain S-box-containing protein